MTSLPGAAIFFGVNSGRIPSAADGARFGGNFRIACRQLSVASNRKRGSTPFYRDKMLATLGDLLSHCAHCGGELTEAGTFCPHCGKNESGAVSPSSAGTAVVAAQEAESEKTFLSTNGATVTSSRIIVPGKTYALADITGVRSTVIAAKRGLAIVIALVGLLMLDGPESGLGVLLLIVGGVWAFAVKNRHAVTLSTASGKVQAVVSKDKAYIDKIVKAVKEAIAYRN